MPPPLVSAISLASGAQAPRSSLLSSHHARQGTANAVRFCSAKTPKMRIRLWRHGADIPNRATPTRGRRRGSTARAARRKTVPPSMCASEEICGIAKNGHRRVADTAANGFRCLGLFCGSYSVRTRSNSTGAIDTGTHSALSIPTLG